MGKINTLNQRGATAIMISMFFIVIITLVTVSYATIVRREQTATLDRNLASQAQYVAESGVNSVRAYIAQQRLANQPVASNSNCNPLAALGSDLTTDFSSLSGVKNTCLTWNTAPPEYTFNLGSYSTKSFQLEDDASYGTNGFGFKLVWNSAGATNTYSLMDPTKLPSTILEPNVSIIKLVTAKLSEVSDYNALQVAYLVPYNSAAGVVPGCMTAGCSPSGSVDLGNTGVGTNPTLPTKGMVYYVPCSSLTCTINVAGIRWPDYPAHGSGPQAFYFENIGAKETKVTFKPAAVGALKGVVLRVDSNAVVQDTSKRLVVDIPLQEQTWQPMFSTLADTLCKDYRVDGVNNDTSLGGGAGCP